MKRFLSSLVCCLSAVSAVSARQEQPADRGVLGSTAAELVLELLDGGTAAFPNLADDDVVLSILVFWSTWSQPSADELERLTELWDIWRGHGVRVVAINVETSRIRAEQLATIRRSLQERPLPFPVAVDDGLLAFHAYGVIAVPTTIVVDASGTIVHRLAGYSVAGGERFTAAVESLVVEDSLAARSSFSQDTAEHRRAVRHMRLARLLSGKGEFELAEYTLQQAVSEDAGLLEARLALAEIYDRLERIDEAEQVLIEASQLFSEDSRLLLARADLERRHGAYTSAEELLRAALTLEPENVGALILQARIRLAGDDVESALALFERAAEANPFDSESRIEIGSLHERLGRPDLALTWYERAYDLLDPSWNP